MSNQNVDNNFNQRDSKFPEFITSANSLEINEEDVHFIRALDSQKEQGKSIFGSGFLLSTKAAAEKAAAEKRNVNIWELSEREKEIVRSLGRGGVS